MSTTPNYDINYDDKRLTQVTDAKDDALTEHEQTYAGMINSTDQYYQKLQDATTAWEEKQTALQNQQTDLTIEQINMQKAQAERDYQKEQSGAYVDWRKQSNEYGTEAEKMAASGLADTGYSESSQVSMYNTYQNRVATARESYQRAVTDYNLAIKDAQLQNNATLAEIAYNALQKRLELSLEGFQYRNQLVIDQANKKLEIDNTFWSRYQDVLDQINTENAMAEEVRQFNQNYELQVKSLEEEIRQYNQDYAEKVRQFNEEIARLKEKDAQEYELEIKNLEIKKQQLAQEAAQHEREMAYKYDTIEE